MEILTSLLTILMIVIFGVLSRRFHIFQKQDVQVLSSFVYYFGLPALFFGKIASLNLYNLDPRLVLAVLLPTLLLLAVLLLSRIMGLLDKDHFVMLSLSVSFGSYAFFGVAFFETFQAGRWLELSILAASLLGVVGIVSTISLLEYATREDRGRAYLVKIMSNPLILSILLGLSFSLLEIRIPFFNQALNLIGQTASGVAIFVLGMYIWDHFSFSSLRQALGYSLFRMIFLPLTALITIQFLLPGQEGVDLFLLLEHGMPAAIALEVFAERYNYKKGEMAGIVTLTSLLNFPVLTGLYYLSQFLY